VSNVGVLGSGPILGLGDDDLRLLLDVHLIAAFRLLRVIGGYWRAEVKAAPGRRRRCGLHHLLGRPVRLSGRSCVQRGPADDPWPPNTSRR